jgi:hypothetical protein
MDQSQSGVSGIIQTARTVLVTPTEPSQYHLRGDVNSMDSETLAQSKTVQRLAPVQRKRVLAGLCFICSHPRGDDGTQVRCRTCATWAIQYARQRRQKRVERVQCIDCGEVREESAKTVRCLRCVKHHRSIARKSRRNKMAVYRGLSADEYNAMLERQGNQCAICGTPSTGRVLCLDHCHATGKVRGLICNLCNFGLGKFKDNPESLRRAAQYIEQSRE